MLKVLFYISFVVISYSCFHRTITADLDFKVFHQASVRVKNGDYDLYNFKRDQIFSYKYSPVFPLLTYSLSNLSEKQARVVWATLNAIALCLAWYTFTHIFLFLSERKVINYSNQILTLWLLAHPLTNNATQGNINLILLAAMGVSLFFSYTNERIFAGIIAAIAFSIKLTPGVLFIYFFAYKKWRELWAAAVTSLLLLFVIPALVYGVCETVELYRSWQIVLADTSHFPFYKYTNQSPLVVMTHWQGLTEANVIAKIFHYAVNGFILYSLWFFYRKKNELLFLAMTFILLLTAAPVVWMEYHIALLLPFLIVNDWLVNKELTRASVFFWWIKLVVVHLAVKFIVGREASDLLAFYGRSFWGLLMTVGIFYIQAEKKSLVQETDKEELSIFKKSA